MSDWRAALRELLAEMEDPNDPVTEVEVARALGEWPS